MKKSALSIVCFIALGFYANAQESTTKEESWDVYLASYDEGVGSTTLNMDLINTAPEKHLPFLVTTGVKFEKDCTADGLPGKDQLEALYEIADEVKKTVAGVTSHEYAGSFTYQCVRLEYFYVSDTTKIRSKLHDLYTSRFGKYKYSVAIQRDERWEAYTDFLYPNPEIQEYMSNQKVIDQLAAAGDDLSKPREVIHYLYFRSEKERDEFAKAIVKDGFLLEDKSKLENSEFPYQLVISKSVDLEIGSITKLTLFLSESAERFNGTYDGWESPIVK